ncbi:MAG: FAD-dependent oxidoreductase [Planctomycetota bacterium]
MKSQTPQRVAVIGAGPIGLEAALYAQTLGHDTTVFERGTIASSVSSWGFVRLFSPWRLNASRLGLACRARRDATSLDLDACPTGRELVDEYLTHLAEELVVHEHTEVVAIRRASWLKSEAIGGGTRQDTPFALLVRDAKGEESYIEADVVIDASGVYRTPLDFGRGGIPPLGLGTRSDDRIVRHIPDVGGSERPNYAGKHTLVVGSGYSAATTVAALHELHGSEDSTRVSWVLRSNRSPLLKRFDDDPLPERDALAQRANEIAERPPAGFEVLTDTTIHSISSDDSGLNVVVESNSNAERKTVRADRIVALVGFRPNWDLSRELQVHLCYASEGPMKLAAALLGASGGDCLEAAPLSPESLKSPEPNFFVVGSKSYGRRNDFLLRTGREQIRDAFRLIEDKSELDLYSEGSE